MARPKLFVGNIQWSTTDAELKEHFSRYGEVLSAVIIMDQNTGESKGYAFVEYASAKAVPLAIRQLHGRSLKGRPLTVKEAQDRRDRGGH